MLRSRPIVRTRSPVRIVRRRRRWNRISWWFSILLLIPLALIALDQLFGIGPGDDSNGTVQTIPTVSFHIQDAATGQPLAGAQVKAGDASASSDERGVASLPRPSSGVTITVSSPGYTPMYGTADDKIGLDQTVALKPDQSSNTAQSAPTPTQALAATETPVAAGGGNPQPTSEPATTQTPAGDKSALQPGDLTGKVTASDGSPIKSALILAGGVAAHSKSNGSYLLRGAPNSGEVRFSAPGYADKKVNLPANGAIDVSLDRQQIKAVYLSGANAGNEDVVSSLIKLADETEVNAMVIDIKENYVWYDTGVQFFKDAGAVEPSYDPRALVQRLHEHGIYAIARSVVFNDPIVAEARQDLAVQDDRGGVWRGADGGAWVNAFNRDLWQPNIDLALEAAGMGFDEIQYDYIRFPSDGDLSTANFGPDYSEEGRVGAIIDFLKMSKEQLEPTGAKLAADVFGIIAIYPDDQGIGQRFADVAKVVDYICPMVYPSHFDPTSIDVGGDPNDFPYETVDLALNLAKQKAPGADLKIRPWLQDFDLGRKYTADDVRAQIRAADEQGTSGWMLWDAANEYTEAALEPQS